MNANDNDEKFIKLTLKNLYTWRFIADKGNFELFLEKCKVGGDFNCSIAENESSVIEMTNCIANTGFFANCKLKAYNCVFHPANLEGDASRERILTNCVLLGTPTEKSTGNIHNCIIIDGYQYCSLPATVRATNCKAIVNAQFRDYLGTQTFTNERLPYDFQAFVEGSFYELLPELAGTWVDEHGSQIGIYGGPKPFSVLPDAPRFIKFDVPAKTDADGHLKVEIEVAMPEK